MNTQVQEVTQNHQINLNSKNHYVPSNDLTAEQLKEKFQIACADDITAALIPFTYLSVEEFEIIHSWFEGLPDRELKISIGEGIQYRMWYYGKHDTKLEVTIKARGECFTYPLEIEIYQARSPEKPSEHSEYCAYSWEEWPKDENGEHYWPDDMGDKHYDPDCYCDWVEDSLKRFTVNDTPDIDPVITYFDTGMEDK